ncbi:hypothetical protein Holit_02875 [Hollandina sp. SP2]
MEIQLPEIQSYLDNIKNGSITEIQLPGMEIKTGEVLTAFSSSRNGGAIHLKVLASEAVPLEAIIVEEAEQRRIESKGRSKRDHAPPPPP